MGLLDAFNTDEGRLGIGLLAAAGPSATPMGFGQRLQGALGALDANKLQQMKVGLLNAQMQNINSEAATRQAALAAAARKQAALPGLFQVPQVSGGEPTPQTEGGLPMFSRPMGVSPLSVTPGGLDVRAALAAGYTPDEIQKLDALRNVGLNKVARTIKATGPDGKEYEYQLDDFGRPVGAPMAQYRAPISVNQGNKTSFLDPYSLSPVTSLQTFQSPDSAASAAVAMRGQNMTDARAREANANGRIPAGYRQTADGGLEFIPGGPADPAAAKRAAPTEFQGKSTTFGARMADAAKVIDELDGKVSPTNVARATYRPEFPNWLPGGQVAGASIAALNKFTVPDDAQRYAQAQENWVTANLRQESGAAIGKDEMQKDIAKWFPQPGDSQAVIQQKAEARKVAERAMLVQAGPGASSIPGIVGDAPLMTPTGGAGGVHWRYVDGKLQKVQ